MRVLPETLSARWVLLGAVTLTALALASDSAPLAAGAGRLVPLASVHAPALGGAGSVGEGWPTPDDGQAATARALAAVGPQQATVGSIARSLTPGRIAVAGVPDDVLVACVLASHRSTGCRLSWPVLAGIGFLESGHAHGHGPGTPRWDGTARPAILVPALDGHGFAAIHDTDHGVLDGDATWDRAVGPMQFLPGTWKRWGADANHDGRADPNNAVDAAAAAADYLCAGGRDLGLPDQVVAAIFSYNHSLEYVRAVLGAADAYSRGGDALLNNALVSLPSGPLVATALPASRPGRAPRRPTVRSRSVECVEGSPAPGFRSQPSPRRHRPPPQARPGRLDHALTRSPPPARPTAQPRLKSRR